ncbi:MAG: Fe-S cluster assembly sulfur transfer protein SufU [Spirochaetaceae bacterium]
MNLGDDLYKEIILDHYKDKKYRRRMDNADISREGANPSCGDDIELFVRLDGERIVEVTYDGAGCSICLASANMLCTALTGRTLSEARSLFDQVRSMLTDTEVPEFPEYATDLEAMQGVRAFPVRVKCAMLAWATLKQVVDEYTHAV